MIAYTDGACRGNPGPGSYAALLFDHTQKPPYKRIISGFREKTTNNEMELGAIFVAIRTAIEMNSPKLTIYTDSKYAINCITKWMKSWKIHNWKTMEGNDVKNQHILKPIDELLTNSDITVTFLHVTGHSGDKYNEQVDTICNEVLDKKTDTKPKKRKK